MKIAVIAVRILMGAMFIFASVAYFFSLVPPQPMSADVQTFNQGIAVSVYLMPLIKSIELICGILLLVNFFVPLVTVVLFPIIVNIVMFHAMLDPKNALIPVFLLLGDLFLAWMYRDLFRPLFRAKASN